MYDSLLAQFAKKPSRETTIIPEKQIKQHLGKLERKAIALFSNSYNTHVEALGSRLEALGSVEQIEKAIAEYKFTLKNELAKNLWGEWLLGLGRGDVDGKEALGRATQAFEETSNDAPSSRLEALEKVKVKEEAQSDFSENLLPLTSPSGAELPRASYADIIPRRWDAGSPLSLLPEESVAIFAEPAIIRNVPAEKAIKERNNTLAADVTNSEWKQIKTALLDTIKPTSPTTPPIGRAELLKRINKVLGSKKNRFRDRARRIARTELTFAYNAGRLNSYIESGLVAGIKFISIWDILRCEICEERDDAIASLDDPKAIAELMPPLHVICRCVLSPVMKTEWETISKEKQRHLKNRNIITKTSPWLMTGILAAILASKGIKVKTSTVTRVTEGIKDTVEIATAGGIQVASSKEQVRRQKAEVKPRASSLEPRASISLSPQVDLQTATFAQLRSLFPKSQLSDKNIYAILDYRDRFGLTSIEDLRNVLGVGGVKLKAVRSQFQNNQLVTFLDPRINQTAIQLWAKSGGVITKSEARKIQKVVQSQPFKTAQDLEEALKVNGIKEKVIRDLKEKAKLSDRQSAIGNQIVEPKAQSLEPVKVGRGGAIVPVRKSTLKPKAKSLQPTRGAILSGIDNTITDIEAQISLLRSRIELDIKARQKQLGLQEVIDKSNAGVTAVKRVSQNLIDEIVPLGTNVTALNNRIKELETKLAGLLNPNVDDYFLSYSPTVKAVRDEIQSLRGELNEVNRFANLETRAASDRAKALTRGQKAVREGIPDRLDDITTIRSQIENVAGKLDAESLAGGNKVAISALSAKYRNLLDTLDDLESLRAKPFRAYAGDKQAISGYLGGVKQKTRNLSNRLSRLEDRIAALPDRVSKLSPSIRKEYRKLPSSLTRTKDYKPPVRIAPGVQGAQARLVKASRADRIATIDNQFNSVNAIATEVRDNADTSWLNKSRQKKLTSITSTKNDLAAKAEKVRKQNAIAAKQSSTTIERIESTVDDLSLKVQADIYDPLAGNWFNDKGIILPQSRKIQSGVKKEIRRAIKDIDNEISALGSTRKKITALKKELQAIRRASNDITLTPAELVNLNRQAELFLAELDGLTKFEVTATYYKKTVASYRTSIDELLKGDSPLLRSRVVTQLDDLLKQVDELENSLSVTTNAGNITTLTQAKERLNSQLERLNKFPKRVKDLPESARIEWEETRGIREVTVKAKQKLDTAVDDYRTSVSSQKSKLNQLQQQIDTSTADVIDSDIYRNNLDDAIKKQQDEIKVAIAELDDNLKLLKLATNTEQGLELVYSDLKQIYDSNVAGLAKITDTKFPVGLDEAMTVKRKITQFLIERGEKIDKQINLILNSDKARSLSRYKLSVIDNQLKKLTDLQKAIRSQKVDATKIEKSLKELFFADPVLHRNLKPASLLEEIQVNAITQSNNIKKAIARLEGVKKQLTEDIKKTLPYGIRDKQIIEIVDGLPVQKNIPSKYVNRDGIKNAIAEYKTLVTELTKTRRPQLEQIGIALKKARVKLYGKNSISENLARHRPLTKGQQKVFDSLQPNQQQLLIEASRTGVLDLYDDLYKMSLIKGTLEDDEIESVKNLFTALGLTDSKRIKRASLKTKKFNEISSHLSRLQGMGYQGLAIEVGEDSAKFIGMSEAPKSLKARKEWELLRKKLGVDRDGNPLPTSPTKIAAMANGTLSLDELSEFAYNEIAEAIAVNRQLRYEIHNRLSAFNFNKYSPGVRYFERSLFKNNRKL